MPRQIIPLITTSACTRVLGVIDLSVIYNLIRICYILYTTSLHIPTFTAARLGMALECRAKPAERIDLSLSCTVELLKLLVSAYYHHCHSRINFRIFLATPRWPGFLPETVNKRRLLLRLRILLLKRHWHQRNTLYLFTETDAYRDVCT